MTNNLKIQQLAPSEFRPVDKGLFDEAEVIRQAEIMRGEVAADLFKRAIGAIRRVFAKMERALDEARTMGELAKLDDKMLADIGISRSDIPNYATRRLNEIRAQAQTAEAQEQRKAA